MSFSAVRWALVQQAPSSAKLILMILADKANDKDECWPSMAALARETSMTRRSVVRCLNKLIKLGLIQREHRFKDNHHQSNMYVLNCSTKAKLKVVGGSDNESLRW